MQSSRITILAVNPGTRYLGVAVIRGTVLIDWGVLVVAGQSSQARAKKAKAIVSRLITEYEPGIFVLKKLHPSRSSAALQRLCHGIRRITEAKKLEIRQYSIADMEAFFEPTGRINKTRMAQMVCREHPVLRHELYREEDNYNPYHIRMFEAVALGVMAQANLTIQPPGSHSS